MRTYWWSWSAVTRADSPFVAIPHFTTKSLPLPTQIPVRNSTRKAAPYTKILAISCWQPKSRASRVMASSEITPGVPKECLERKKLRRDLTKGEIE